MYFLFFYNKNFHSSDVTRCQFDTFAQLFFFHQNGETMWKCAITSHKVTNIHTAVFLLNISFLCKCGGARSLVWHDSATWAAFLHSNVVSWMPIWTRCIDLVSTLQGRYPQSYFVCNEDFSFCLVPPQRIFGDWNVKANVVAVRTRGPYLTWNSQLKS